MTRDDILNFLANKLNKSLLEIDSSFKDCHERFNGERCEELVQEALDEYELIEYRAAKAILEYLFKGEK